MQQILERFCRKDEQGRLLLLDMPTGSGKTYNVCKFIRSEILKGSKQRFFFITTLKKNLPEEELKKQFEKKGSLEVFKEKFLLVKPYNESVREGLANGAKIPDEITETDEYKALKQNLETIQNFKGGRSEILENSLRDAEYKFRKKVSESLKRHFPKKEDRLNAIKNASKWQWICKLYPMSLIGERQIIFMSVDKFLSPYSTIIEPAGMLYNSEWLKDSVIFMDEFDATKETMLRNIIGNSLRKKFDYVELLKNIYASLQTRSLPAKLTTESEKRKISRETHGPKIKPLDSILADLKEKAETLRNEFSLDFSFKTDASKDELQDIFLFQDHRFITANRGQESCIKWQRDAKNQINHITFCAEQKGEDGNVPIMLGRLRGFISYFVNCIRKFATNYYQNNGGGLTLEAATRSVLKEFGLDEESINHLTDLVLMRPYKQNDKAEGRDKDDLSLYHKGFRYYSFEDDETHDLQSKIMMVDFNDTPEKLLLKFCERAKVVGISATASLPSVVGNFDLSYIKAKLGEGFCHLTEEEKARLKAEFEKSTSGYGSVKIHAELIDSSGYGPASWQKVVEDQEIAECLFRKLEEAQAGDENDYNKRRYFKIALAFKNFLAHKDIHSFLCVLNKHPKPNGKALNRNLLDEIFAQIAKDQKIQFQPNQIFQLYGEGYDDKRRELLDRLGNGEKLFVISAYQTVGAGQNLQYKIPETLKDSLVKINELPQSGYKDFDAIYLDKPTNLLVNLNGQGEFKLEEFAKSLFQTEFLQEAGEISVKDAKTCIRKAFARLRGLSEPKAVGNGKCPSVILMATRAIIQAIGRMCRTNNKAPNIYIYADAEISGAITPNVDSGRISNPEFLALLDIVKAKLERQPSVLENRASLISQRTGKYIDNIRYGNWTEDKMEQWKQLREMVLRSPTLPKEEANFAAKNFYVELPEKANCLYYSESSDYKEVNVSFKASGGLKCVSAEAAKLTEFMRVPWLREHFEKQGFATAFEPNDFIMSPTLFNNIYRGALGEAAGKAIFEHWLGIDLEEVDNPEFFELFDFKIPNSSVFIDFKNWHESSEFSAEEMERKIVTKAERCGAKCVIIANISAEKHYRIVDKMKAGIRIIEVPSLLQRTESPNQQAMEKVVEVMRNYGHQAQQAQTQN